MIKLEKKVVLRQDWIESEKGWGTRSDGCSLHLTREDRNAYIKAYWDNMPDEVPSEYSRGCGNPYEFQVSLEIFEKVQGSDQGIRVWQHEIKKIS
jgi:hypothetical protein